MWLPMAHSAALTRGGGDERYRKWIEPNRAALSERAGINRHGNNLCCEPAALDYVAGMDWQQAVSLLIVAATAGVFLWTRFRRRQFRFERDTHCGCSSPGQSAPQRSIVFHARKGERPQIILKSQ